MQNLKINTWHYFWTNNINEKKTIILSEIVSQLFCVYLEFRIYLSVAILMELQREVSWIKI